LTREALDLRWCNFDGGIWSRCKHLICNSICFPFEWIVARAYGQLRLHEFLAFTICAFAGE
jgi:hypothetical protein